MRVQVAYVTQDIDLLVAVDLADGSTVADALRIADIARRIGCPPDNGGLAIYGQRVDSSTPLREGDRVEITRPLTADPKAVRRVRAGRNVANKTADRPHAHRRRRSAI